MSGNSIMQTHAFVRLFSIAALVFAVSSGISSYVFRNYVDEVKYNRAVVVSQNHVSTFIIYYFGRGGMGGSLMFPRIVLLSWILIATAIVFSWWEGYKKWFEILVASIGGLVLLWTGTTLGRLFWCAK